MDPAVTAETEGCSVYYVEKGIYNRKQAENGGAE